MRQVGYRPNTFTADTGRMPTKQIWDNIPWSSIEDGQIEGHVHWDDFMNFPDFAATEVINGPYATHADASCDISQTADSEYGEARLTLSAATDDEAELGHSGNAAASFKFIKPSVGVPHTVAFEARVKTSVLLGSTFIGLAEEGCVAADGFMSATGTLPDKDLIGFFLPEADVDGWDFTYKKNGGTANTVAADCGTAVADTYIKLGFIYNYKNRQDQVIKAYVNGVKCSSYVTKTLVEVTLDFPAGEEMGPLFAHRNVTDIQSATIDWWKMAQVINA